MILAALLSNLGAAPDANGYDHAAMCDGATGVLWLIVVHVEPGGPVTGSIIRGDPGTMGRALFHFRATPRDGWHGLDYISLDGSLTADALPALPAVCAFMRSAWIEIAAERVPALEVLAPLQLGLALPVPPVLPGAKPGGMFLRFDVSDEA